MRSVIICTLLVAACGGGSSDHSIDTSKYSHACMGDGDCVAVYQGTLSCCGGDCPNAVIAATDYDAYTAALAAQMPICNPAPSCVDTTGACTDRSALCVGGLCTLAITSTSAISASP